METATSEVMLQDHTWHPCAIIGTSPALDYDGDRINLRLTAPATIRESGKKEYTFPAGFAFYECHTECVRRCDDEI